MVNKKNRREAVKNAPFNRYNGVLNHLTTEKIQRSRSRYSPTSDTEKGKIPKIRSKYPFQDRIYSYRISLGKAGYLPGAKA